MANINSYYLYQKYEKRGDQPWIPLDVYSVDGDGTMPLVVKQLNDSSCVPTYRTTSGTPYCVNFDKYVDVTTEETFDDGVTWYFVSLTPTLVEADSDDCGVLYRWVESGTTCIGFDKRQNNIKEKSKDGGTTWTVVTPAEYSASTLIEHNSYDCGYVSQKYVLTLNDSSIASAPCQGESDSIDESISHQYSGTAVSAVIGDCVTQIKRYSFFNCRSLTSVEIPSSITRIGDALEKYVFSYCTSLTSITIPDSVEIIGLGAFDGCESLRSVTFGSGLTSILSEAFGNCSSLVNIDIPNNVTLIDEYAFANCYNLRSIRLSTSLTTLGENVFLNCTGLTSISIPSGVTSINGGAFSSCYSLRSVTLPSGLTKIGNLAFSGCFSLVSIDIPNNVTTIGEYAFGSCSGLTSIIIPSSVTNIKNGAFKECTSLMSITSLSSTPPSLGTITGPFDDTNNCPIYVPSGSVGAYKSAWNRYSDRIRGI